jgi:hypothetical protein
MLDKIKEFLVEYDKLCQKYHMGLVGCGCCGSPSLRYDRNYYKNNEDDESIDDINYNYVVNKVFIGSDGFYTERLIEIDKADYIKWNEYYNKALKEKTVETYFEE